MKEKELLSPEQCVKWLEKRASSWEKSAGRMKVHASLDAEHRRYLRMAAKLRRCAELIDDRGASRVAAEARAYAEEMLLKITRCYSLDDACDEARLAGVRLEALEFLRTGFVRVGRADRSFFVPDIGI